MGRCQNCGHENDEDADFCENCGNKLKTNFSDRQIINKPSKNENIAQSTKILIIVCIVLVIGFGIAVGILIKNSQHNTQDISATNNTTPTQIAVNNTTKNTQSDKNKIISPSQAIAIANKYAKSFGEKSTGSVDYINGIGDYHGADGDPYYHVELKWITPHNSDDPPTAWFVEIDAKTGAINPRN